MCSGKVYYDLVAQAREERGLDEQDRADPPRAARPFPEKALTERAQALSSSNARYVWCQEEPRNMGAWFFT